MQKYEICVWFTGPFPSADVTVFLEMTRGADVKDVAEGVLRLLGQPYAAYIVVLDVAVGCPSTFKDVVL